MVQVTEKALDQLETVRDENALPAGQGIALVPRAAGEFGFVAAAPEPEDQVIERSRPGQLRRSVRQTGCRLC